MQSLEVGVVGTTCTRRAFTQSLQPYHNSWTGRVILKPYHRLKSIELLAVPGMVACGSLYIVRLRVLSCALTSLEGRLPTWVQRNHVSGSRHWYLLTAGWPLSFSCFSTVFYHCLGIIVLVQLSGRTVWVCRGRR